ncbi:TPA: nucleotidyltransferase family protein [Photobacterium damselae]
MTVPPVILIDILKRPSLLTSLSEQHQSAILTEARHVNLLGQLQYLCHQHDVFDDLFLHSQQTLLSGQQAHLAQCKQLNDYHSVLTQALTQATSTWSYINQAGIQFSQQQSRLGYLRQTTEILVSHNAIHHIEKCLLTHGWRPKLISDYDEKSRIRYTNALSPFIHQESNLELVVHYQLLPKRFRYSSDDTFTRKLIYPDSCYPASIFDPISTIYHLAINLFFINDSKFGLRDIFTLYSLLNENSLQEGFWGELLTFQNKVGKDSSLFLALHFCHVLFDLAIPDFVSQYYHQQFKVSVTLNSLETSYIDLFSYAFPPYQDDDYKLAARLLRIRGCIKQMPLYLLLPHIIKRGIWNCLPHESEEELIC